MRFLDTLLASIVMCISSLPLILVILTLETNPALPANPPLDQQQVAQIQQLLIDHDPRQLLASPNQEVRLTEAELNALVTYLKDNNQVLESVSIQTRLVEEGVRISLSVPARALGILRYFNINFDFERQENRLVLSSMDVGALTIPSLLISSLQQTLAFHLSDNDNFQLVASFIDSLQFQSINQERMVIMLDWQEEQLQELGDQARQVFVSTREAQRILYYQEQLLTGLSELPEGIAAISLNDLMRPLFLFASVNTGGGSDPVAENRAVFIVLTAYLTDLELGQLIGNEVRIPQPRVIRVLIDSREDLARHVVSSAAISASAGATMAQVLSVYKEVQDSRFRTGFSFTDLAANEAGSLLGTLATRSRTDAILFQQKMLTIATEAEFLPSLGTYDGMTEEEFITTYGNRESEAYNARLDEIHDSILSRPFYQDF